MQATAVAPVAEPGNLTVELQTLDSHFTKLLRFRSLKQQLAELRAEHDRLQRELTEEGAL